MKPIEQKADQLRDELEKFVISLSAHNNEILHIPQKTPDGTYTNAPYCNNTAGRKTTSWDLADSSTYPRPWKRMCLHCVKDYINN